MSDVGHRVSNVEVKERRRATRSSSRGFTLAELLVVVGIIALLSGLIMATFRGLMARQMLNDAIADIEQIRAALEAYERAWGDYPPCSDPKLHRPNVGNALLVACLSGDSTLPVGDPRRGPFVKEYTLRDKSRIRWVGNLLLWVDPWENPYIYFDRNALREYTVDECPQYCLLGYADDEEGAHIAPRKDEAGVFYGTTSFQVWSCGPDKRTMVEAVVAFDPATQGTVTWGRPETERFSRDDIASWGEEGSR